jgi:hypothetical protein
MRLLGFLITGVLLLASVGCGVSASVHGGVITGDGPYRSAWKQSWQRVIEDEARYAATATSPGACNAGSTKQACVNADQKLASDLRVMQEALSTVHVPDEYSRATALTMQALAHDLRALTLRMRSLSAGDWTLAQRNAWFQESKSEFAAAYTLFARAWTAFPDWARPSPAPRI